jgi:hypothetical protein
MPSEAGRYTDLSSLSDGVCSRPHPKDLPAYGLLQRRVRYCLAGAPMDSVAHLRARSKHGW